jgi:hypothetical protein
MITGNPKPDVRVGPPRPSGLEVPVIEGGFPHSEIYGSKAVRTSP